MKTIALLAFASLFVVAHSAPIRFNATPITAPPGWEGKQILNVAPSGYLTMKSGDRTYMVPPTGGAGLDLFSFVVPKANQSISYGGMLRGGAVMVNEYHYWTGGYHEGGDSSGVYLFLDGKFVRDLYLIGNSYSSYNTIVGGTQGPQNQKAWAKHYYDSRYGDNSWSYAYLDNDLHIKGLSISNPLGYDVESTPRVFGGSREIIGRHTGYWDDVYVYDIATRKTRWMRDDGGPRMVDVVCANGVGAYIGRETDNGPLVLRFNKQIQPLKPYLPNGTINLSQIDDGMVAIGGASGAGPVIWQNGETYAASELIDGYSGPSIANLIEIQSNHTILAKDVNGNFVRLVAVPEPSMLIGMSVGIAIMLKRRQRVRGMLRSTLDA